MRFVMILYRLNAVILLQLLAVSVVVKSHVCLLKKRPDPSLGGTLRWSLLLKELCYCQGVVAPRFISPKNTCSVKDQSCSNDNACLWFVDDPTPLTQRHNWNKDTLDMLLERATYCKETTQAVTENASLKQKSDAVEASTSTDQDETTQAEIEGGNSSQKTDAVEASTSTDQDETTQAEIEGGNSSQKTDAVEASTSTDQDETTQAETEGASSSQKTDAVEASTSADEAETTRAETEGASTGQKTDAVEASTSADQEETAQVERWGASSSQKADAVEASTPTNQDETTQAETEGASSSQKTDAVSADEEETTRAETEGASTSQKTSTSADPECESGPLGMADKSIPDASITASSHQNGRLPKHARLGGNGFWISISDNLQPWIQVDMGSSHRVTGLQTEGNHVTPYWVEQLKVKVGMSEPSLMFIDYINGQPKVFDANTDHNHVVEIILDESGIRTRLVRIYPTICKKEEKLWYVCLMRFEILGCLEN